MESNPYIGFKGECEAAFKFYEKILGAKIEALVTFADTPVAESTAPEWRKKIIHGRISIGNSVLMAGDMPPERYEQQKGYSITLRISSPAEAENVFNALAEKGSIRMPLQQTFFSPNFGSVVDQFGIPWMILCEHKQKD